MASAIWLLSPSLACRADTCTRLPLSESQTDQEVLLLQSSSLSSSLLLPRSWPSNADMGRQQWRLATSSPIFSFPNTFPPFLVATAVPVQEPGAVLDEVWTLIDKYYIDRSFHGQDWKRTKEVYEAQLLEATKAIPQQENSNNIANEVEMKVVNKMVKTLEDKYTRLLSVEQYTAIQKYDLIGVGVTLMPSSVDGKNGNDNNVNKNGETTNTMSSDSEIIVGAPPIAGSPADRAGIQAGDKVTKINGIPTKGRTAFDIIDQIAENPDAKTVTMTIQSSQGGGSSSSSPSKPPRDVVLERQFQKIQNPIQYKITERRSDGTIVGFIRITEFNSLVKANLEEALKNLKTVDGANAFVIDLRRNGGGAFQSAVEVSSLFFENAVATYVVDGTTATLPFKTATGQVLIDSADPIVVWMDGSSASASEVFAASLHDNCKAVLMGEKSFGKGLIQAVYGLKNGAGLVLTVAKYVTPNHAEIQGLGIQPDIPGQNIVPSPGVRSLLGGGLGTDTSKIDFADIRSRLSTGMCATTGQT